MIAIAQYAWEYKKPEELTDAEITSIHVLWRQEKLNDEQRAIYYGWMRHQLSQENSNYILYDKKSATYNIKIPGATGMYKVPKTDLEAFLGGDNTKVTLYGHPEMTAEEAYDVLTSVFSCPNESSRAYNYYLKHSDEMNEAYPDLAEKFAEEKATRDSFEKLSGIHISNTADDATIEKMSEFYLGNSDRNLMDEDTFRLPDMGDFYIGNVDDSYMTILDNKLREAQNAEQAAYYTESLPFRDLGWNKDRNLFMFKVDIKDPALWTQDYNVDAETIPLHVSWLQGDPDGIAVKALQSRIKDSLTEFSAINTDQVADNFTVSLVGINAYRSRKLAREENVSSDLVKFASEKDGTGTGTNYVFICNRWHQCYGVENNADGTVSFTWVIKEDGVNKDSGISEPERGYQSAAMSQTDKIQDLIEKGNGELYLLLDGDGVPPYSTINEPAIGKGISDMGYAGQLGNLASGCSAENKPYCGLAQVHQDSLRRFYGTLYVKDPDNDKVFINVAKFLTYDKDGIKTDPEKYEGGNGDVFDTKGYDKETRQYADAFFKAFDELDDRDGIQQDIFGKTWDELANWTVTIGDVTFFVPPVNIHVETYNQSARVPLIRARGSMTRTDEAMNRLLVLDIYFCGPVGINGVDYGVKLPNGETVTYAMNGLRTLVSAFKFTPFLPVTNHYINNVLGIDAVQFENMRIESVTGFPTMIHATILLRHFKWQVFMPDITQLSMLSEYRDSYTDKQDSVDGIEKEDYAEVPSISEQKEYENSQPYQNWFALSFNWPVYRYYIQRAIRRGNYLRTCGFSFNSTEYVKLTSSGKTGLVPMSFTDPTIRFYMANEEYLRKVYKARYDYLNKVGSSTTTKGLTDNEKEFLESLGRLYSALYETASTDEFQTALTETNAEMPEIYKQGLYSNDKSIAGVRKMLSTLKNAFENNCDSNYFTGQAETYIKTTDTNIKTSDGYVKTKYQYVLALYLRGDYLSVADMDSFKKNMSAYLGISTQEIFQDDKIEIPLYTYISKRGRWRTFADSVWAVDQSTPSMKVLATADELSQVTSASNFVPDVAALQNISFDEYDVGTTTVTDWNVEMANTFAMMRTLNQDLQASQFIGGTDIRIRCTIVTDSEETVAMLKAIPEEISRMTRQYHMVMPCVPLRVDSEFTRFFGVNEVTVENMTVNTREKTPGYFVVQFELVSLDRTLRDREAAERQSLHNEGLVIMNTDVANYGLPNQEEGFLGIAWSSRSDDYITNPFIKYNPITAPIANSVNIWSRAINGEVSRGWNYQGSALSDIWNYGPFDAHYMSTSRTRTGSGVEQNRKLNGYFEAKSLIAKQDLYPDLELPTLEQMESVGYYYLRYKFQDERVYVDPDFYIIYPVSLTSQIYRELAMNCVSSGLSDTTFRDSSGGEVKVTPAFGTGFKVTEQNDIAKKQAETYKNLTLARKTLDEMKAQDNKENLKEKDKRSNVLNLQLKLRELDSWKIASTIEARFLERNFLKEYESYLAKQNSETATDEMKKTEGAFVAAQLKASKEAAEALLEYLKTTNLETDITSSYNEYYEITDAQRANYQDMINRLYNKPKKYEDRTIKSDPEMPKSDTITTGRQQRLSGLVPAEIKRDSTSNSEFKSTIYSTAEEFIKRSIISIHLKKINFTIDNADFLKAYNTIIYAAACALTGQKEYSGDKNATDWLPNIHYIGIKAGGVQDAGGADLIDDLDEEGIWKIVKTGIRFGYFDFRMYTRKELASITEEVIENKPDEEKEQGNVNSMYYLLDPYFRRPDTTVADVERYKVGCICSAKYATEAFCRIVIYWLCKLIQMNALPTIMSDVMRDITKRELRTNVIEREVTGVDLPNTFTDQNTGTIQDLERMIQFFSNQDPIVDSGKIWTAAVLAVSDGEPSLIKMIKARNYKGLNAFIDSIGSPALTVYHKDRSSVAIRKMVRALVGTGMISDFNALGITPTDPAVDHARDYMQHKYISAAEDPKQYIPHSFHDMIVHDVRGRLLRAFPTYYLCFIDEGRQIGRWKLHDNFYNTSAIMSIDIVKSRKMAADTAVVVMSNFYQSYATESEDYIKTITASFDDMYDSIFNMSSYFKKQETRRRNKPPEVRLRLRPGARIHIRMGYGNNADMLPVLFNGVIADVSAESTVTIVAQGDGRELLNPILQDTEAHKIEHQDDFLPGSMDNNSTPLEICNGLFNTYGGFMNEQLRKRMGWTFAGERNPYGIVHLGDPDFKTLCKQGETLQNIFEATSHPVYAGTVDIENTMYADYMEDVPKITFDVFQKTPWDVLNICKSVTPDFRLAVLPFGFRSTTFMGAPRYYYCYDYVKSPEGVVFEKRKPFQQWHLYTSSQDIVGNGITATTRDMKTAAVGLYRVLSSFNIEVQETVGPLWADYDIYPESQQTMIVDTNLLGRGPMFLGFITNLTQNHLGDMFRDENSSHEKIAWRSTASALRESVQDMYAGDLIVYGDPTVKPHDRFYIDDPYSGISGQALVKEVVHHMSADQGYITTISPDCIAAVDSMHDLMVHESMNKVGGFGAAMAHYASYVAVGITSRVIAGAFVQGTKNPVKAIASSAGQLLKNTGTNLKAIAAAVKGAKGIRGVLSAVSFARLAMLAGGVAAGGPITIGIGLAMTLASVMIGPAVNALIERWLKNLKVVTIFPLKKYGHVYIAGFEGAKGSVYGSPTWNEPGMIGEALKAIKDKCPIAGDIAELLASDEVNALAHKLMKDNDIIDENGTPTQQESAYGEILRHAIGDDKSYAQDYRAQMIKPRAKNKADVYNSYNNFKVTDVDNFRTDPKLRNFRMISSDSRFTPYIDEEFFIVLHEYPALNEGISVSEELIKIRDGEEYRIKAIHCQDDDKNYVIDLPMLHPEALNILYEIIRLTRNNMPAVNSSDPLEDHNITAKSFLVLKSALRVGDRTSRAAAGFTFILQCTEEEYTKAALKKALEELRDKLTTEYTKDLGDINTDIFQYKETDNEVAVVVTMPKVQNNEQQTDTTEDNYFGSDTAVADITEEELSGEDVDHA